MARVDLTLGIQTIDPDGVNLTDLTAQSMVIGAGNGVEVPFEAGPIYLLLRNDQAGAAQYDIIVVQDDKYADRNITIPDAAVAVAASKDHLYPLAAIYKQPTDKLFVDCDVTAKIAAIRF